MTEETKKTDKTENNKDSESLFDRIASVAANKGDSKLVDLTRKISFQHVLRVLGLKEK